MSDSLPTLTKRDRFLRACRGQPCDRPPVWFMRQAGRFLPEYREVRAKVDFLTLCKTPELAAEVTFQPLRRFGFDAAILFSDILVVPEAMGLKLSFGAGEGPRFADPVRSRDDLARLRAIDPGRDLAYVPAAIRAIKAGLPDGEALIGFAGAPFTLACYMVEGEGSASFARVRTMMHADRETYDALMRRLADAVADYLLAQVEAGADAVQLFDTWAGLLDGPTWAARVAPHVRTVLERLAGAGVPRIYFAAGGAHLLPHLATLGMEVAGVDWRSPLTVGARAAAARHRGAGQPRPGAAARPGRGRRGAGARDPRRGRRRSRPHLQPGARRAAGHPARDRVGRRRGGARLPVAALDIEEGAMDERLYDLVLKYDRPGAALHQLPDRPRVARRLRPRRLRRRPGRGRRRARPAAGAVRARAVLRGALHLLRLQRGHHAAARDRRPVPRPARAGDRPGGRPARRRAAA